MHASPRKQDSSYSKLHAQSGDSRPHDSWALERCKKEEISPIHFGLSPSEALHDQVARRSNLFIYRVTAKPLGMSPTDFSVRSEKMMQAATLSSEQVRRPLSVASKRVRASKLTAKHAKHLPRMTRECLRDRLRIQSRCLAFPTLSSFFHLRHTIDRAGAAQPQLPVWRPGNLKRRREERNRV